MTVLAQLSLTGQILDSLHKSPLMYVNIGIKKQNIGTVSSEDGSFELHIPKALEKDTLTFSLVGYGEINLPLQNLHTINPLKILLPQKIIPLERVQIMAKKSKEHKFGIKRRGLLIHFSDGMFNPEDSFEIGQLIKLGKGQIKITSMNFYALSSDDQPSKFRINFYRYADGKPMEKLIHKSLIEQKVITEGWVKFDLSDQEIYLSGDVIAALEFLPPEDTLQKQINYEVKLGGSSKSFYRKNSLGEWNTPPHHYCLNITGLVNLGTPLPPDEDYESSPTFVYPSNVIGEDYYIYVNLPKGYKQKKNVKYPVIYLLDGNAYFDHIKNYVRESSEKNRFEKEPIIIGIGYKNAYFMDSLRIRDYTYPKALAQDSFSTSGGADLFYSFITNELIPHIDRNYNTDTTARTIMGHSFGGYFSLYALLREMQSPAVKHQVFSNYISASPSINYYNNYILTQLEKLEKHKSHTLQKNSDLYATMGSNELEGEMHQRFHMFRQILKDYRSLHLKTKVYQNKDHLGTAIPSFEDAIKRLYK